MIAQETGFAIWLDKHSGGKRKQPSSVASGESGSISSPCGVSYTVMIILRFRESAEAGDYLQFLPVLR